MDENTFFLFWYFSILKINNTIPFLRYFLLFSTFFLKFLSKREEILMIFS